MLRARATSPEELLDQAILDRLRSTAPADGSDARREQVDEFLRQVPQLLAQLSQNIREPANLAAHAQALNTLSGQLGAKRIAKLCQKLEELGHSGSIDSAPAVLQELRATFALTRTQLLPLVAPSSLESAS